MTHPLIEQLRFTRSEWLRALDGVNDEDARKRLQRLTRGADGIELRCKQLYHDREEVTLFARAIS